MKLSYYLLTLRKSTTLRQYFNANLYHILPCLLILLFVILLHPPFVQWLEPWLSKNIDMCGLMGGRVTSVDQCRISTDNFDLYAVLHGILIGSVLAWGITKLSLRNPFTRWRTAYDGIIVFYSYVILLIGVVILHYIIVFMFASRFSEQQLILPLAATYLIGLTIGFIRLTFRNLIRYQQWETEMILTNHMVAEKTKNGD